MRVGAEGDEVRGRAAGTDGGVTPSDGRGGLEEGGWGVVRRAETRGLDSSCGWREEF